MLPEEERFEPLPGILRLVVPTVSSWGWARPSWSWCPECSAVRR